MQLLKSKKKVESRQAMLPRLWLWSLKMDACLHVLNLLDLLVDLTSATFSFATKS